MSTKKAHLTWTKLSKRLLRPDCVRAHLPVIFFVAGNSLTGCGEYEFARICFSGSNFQFLTLVVSDRFCEVWKSWR